MKPSWKLKFDKNSFQEGHLSARCFLVLLVWLNVLFLSDKSQ